MSQYLTLEPRQAISYHILVTGWYLNKMEYSCRANAHRINFALFGALWVR